VGALCSVTLAKGYVVEPLYQRMAERVRKSHVVATDDTVLPMLSPGQTQPARMWVYVGDEVNPDNVFDFTLNRSREGPKEFLKDYTEVLLADAYGGYNGVVAGNAITRAGCWSHARRKFVDAKKSAPEIARQAVTLIDALFALSVPFKIALDLDRIRSAKTCSRVNRTERSKAPSNGFAARSGHSTKSVLSISISEMSPLVPFHTNS